MRLSTKLLLITVALTFLSFSSAFAVQDIKESIMLHKFIGENYEMNKGLIRVAHEMQYEAEPFLKQRHRERYRFAPNTKYARKVMIVARKMVSRFKMVNGLLYHSELPNRELLFKQIYESTESLSTYGKRAIRAINDNNYALYLASARGVEKEVFHLNELMNSLEIAVNDVIVESDAAKEAL